MSVRRRNQTIIAILEQLLLCCFQSFNSFAGVSRIDTAHFLRVSYNVNTYLSLSAIALLFSCLALARKLVKDLEYIYANILLLRKFAMVIVILVPEM